MHVLVSMDILFFVKIIIIIWKYIILANDDRNWVPAKLSAIWKGIIIARILVDIGIDKKLGDGITVLFWIDRWCEENCSLRCIFPKLFQIIYNPSIIVAANFINDSLEMD